MDVQYRIVKIFANPTQLIHLQLESQAKTHVYYTHPGRNTPGNATCPRLSTLTRLSTLNVSNYPRNFFIIFGQIAYLLLNKSSKCGFKSPR